MLLSVDGEVLDANAGLCRLLGVARESLLSRPVATLGRGGRDVSALSEALDAAGSGDLAGEFTQRWSPAHEPDRVLHLRVVWTRRDPGCGLPEHLVAVVLDETPQVQMRDDLALRDQRFRSRFDLSPVPQVFTDSEGRMIEVNDAFCSLVGRIRDDLLDRPLDTLTHAADPGLAGSELARLLSGDNDAVQVEQVLHGADGRSIPALVHATALRESDGTPVGVSAYVQDLSALRAIERRTKRQEHFFTAVAELTSDLALIASAHGRLIYASPGLSGMLGYTAEEVVDTSAWDYVHADDRDVVQEMYRSVVHDKVTRTATMRIRDAAGGWVWVEGSATNLLDTEVAAIVCSLRDISERVEAEAALRSSESRYRAMADNADEGLWVATPQGRTLYVNDRMAEILGVPAEEIYARSVPDLLDPDHSSLVSQRLGARSTRGPERYELVYRHPDGGRRILQVAAAPLIDDEGIFEGSLAMVSDITASRRLEEELRRAALHDGLTGLPNRALLLDRLEHALTRETTSTAVLFVDLDQFKIVNDARGHSAGDELLVGVAERLRLGARPTDTVARFGGDEFLVVCEDVDADTAHTIAQELLGSLDAPFHITGGRVHVAASIGVALSPADGAGDLLRNADTAMYAAKVAGRHRVRMFDAKLAQQAEERYELGAELRSALEDDELTMHYQPIVDLTSGRVVGVEALARWHHPRHGVVSPDRFVVLAEETGLAPELDRWALRRALREAGALRDGGDLPPDAYVSINLSAYNLTDPGLEELIADCSLRAGLAPHAVLLEITESAIMGDATSAVALLQRLRDRGFLIAVDDFGTGHSSLSYLRTLPISTLKIDRSFVAEITEDTNALAIATSIVDLARAIGVTVVAEGVESAEQARLLRELGCGSAQGWLWSAALSPDEARLSGGLTTGYDVGD
ncbi:sensor domain-containing protein [Nocardioides pacificus]